MKKKGYQHLWNLLLRLLFVDNKLVRERVSLDGSLIQSFEFIDTTGYSGKHHMVGTKISTIADGNGIPLAITFAHGNRHDLFLAPETVNSLEFAPSKLKLTNFLADKGYDSRLFRQCILSHQMVPFIHKRTNTKIKKKYQLLYLVNTALQKKRYVVEQTNAWMKSFRRIRHRFDYTLLSFQSFVHLAILVICVRRLML